MQNRHINDVIVQRPQGEAAQLFLLYHAAGDNAVAMGQIGVWFARTFPQAWVISVASPLPCDDAQGQQWFQQTGHCDRTLRQRVDAALPALADSVRHWQQQSGIAARGTALVGFSQGSTMVLEGIIADPLLAARVVAFSGRLITRPEAISRSNTLHLIHGEDDERIPLAEAQQTAEWLTALGGDVTLDVVADLPHAIDDRSMQLALNHLRYTVPKHYFDEASGGGTPGDDDVIMMM